MLRYQATLGPPLAPTTARRKLSSLRAVLKHLKKKGQGPKGDLPRAIVGRRQRLLPKALSIQDLEALLNAADEPTPTGRRDRVLMELIFGTGLRISEALGLGIEDIRDDFIALRVTGKRGKTRWVPIPIETQRWLREYLAEVRPALIKRPQKPVILSDRGYPMNRTHAYARLQRLAIKAGLSGHFGPHVLRHTYAVHLLKGGADLRAVQELLGHESIATTQIYTELDTTAVQASYQRAHPRG